MFSQLRLKKWFFVVIIIEMKERRINPTKLDIKKRLVLIDLYMYSKNDIFLTLNNLGISSLSRGCS